MSQSFTIALDAMGGDAGVESVVPAALKVARRHGEHVRLLLVGQSERLEEAIAAGGGTGLAGIEVQHAAEVVGMDEAPSQALRTKKNSSMRVAINLVKEGRADACVSAGNTGALMATARYVLKTLPGIDRPAICTAIPCQGGYVRVLDLGANVDTTAEHLFQFAVMGSVLTEALDGLERPRIGLLNLGEEEIKGNDQVKQAATMLQASDLNYVGYVEGDTLYRGVADVVVCDGFVGNVALKSSEGVAWLIASFLREEFKRSVFTRLAGLVALPVLRSLRRRLDPRVYNGASLLGLRGVVIKSHGSADALAFERAIEVGIREARSAVPSLIDQRLGAVFSEQAGQP